MGLTAASHEEIQMRFMVIVKATKDSEAGVMPTPEQLAEMGAFNEQLVKAGVMLAGDGLSPARRALASPSTARTARWWTVRSPKPRS